MLCYYMDFVTKKKRTAKKICVNIVEGRLILCKRKQGNIILCLILQFFISGSNGNQKMHYIFQTTFASFPSELHEPKIALRLVQSIFPLISLNSSRNSVFLFPTNIICEQTGPSQGWISGFILIINASHS